MGAVAVLTALVGVAPATAQNPAFEAEVFMQLNEVRSNPPLFAKDIAETRSRFDGKILRGRSRDEIDIQTHEGIAAVDEAVHALRRASSVSTVRHSDLLQRIARDLVQEQSRSGGLGHVSQGRGPGERSLARGGGRYLSEIITYGHSDPASVMEQFLVGDGVPNRGHRKTVLGAEFRYAGVACGVHPLHRKMCVIMLSATPDGKPLPPPSRE